MATIGIFLSIILTLFILRRAYAKNCLKNLNITLSISAPAATEGDTLVLTEVLANNKWLPLPWVAAKFQTAKELLFETSTVGTDAYYRNDLFHILMHQRITRRLPFTCTRRGFYTIKGLELTAWDILLEAKHIRKCDCNINLTVYPATLPIHEMDALCTYVYGQLRTRIPINPDPFTFAGIREYATGDSMKAINFKASARGMGLMVNKWEFVNARQVAILLDAKRYGMAYNEYPEERAVKIAASVADKMTRAGTPVKFVTNGRSVISGEVATVGMGQGSTHLYSVLESLAYLDFNNQDVSDFSREIDDIITVGDFVPEYWIITPYFSKEVETAYGRLKAAGARVVWVMPAPKPSYEELCEGIVFI